MLKAIINPFTYFKRADFKLKFARWRWRTAAHNGLIRYILRKRFEIEAKHLECEVFGMKYSSPIGLAAGFDRLLGEEGVGGLPPATHDED